MINPAYNSNTVTTSGKPMMLTKPVTIESLNGDVPLAFEYVVRSRKQLDHGDVLTIDMIPIEMTYLQFHDRFEVIVTTKDRVYRAPVVTFGHLDTL